MYPRPATEHMAFSIPGLVHASGDEAVSRSKEIRQVVHLLIGGGEFFMQVIDARLKAVNLNGMLFEGAPHSRADDVDDAGLGNDVVVRVQGIEGRALGEERIIWMMIWFEEEHPINGTDRRFIDLIWFNPTNFTGHDTSKGKVNGGCDSNPLVVFQMSGNEENV